MLEPAEVDARILSALSRATQLAPSRLRPEASLQELEVTSLDYVNVLFEVEEEFDVELPQEAEGELGRPGSVVTVGEVVARLRQAVLAAGAR